MEVWDPCAAFENKKKMHFPALAGRALRGAVLRTFFLLAIGRRTRVFLFLLSLLGFYLENLSTQLEFLLAVSVREKATVADPDKAFRQYVREESAEELDSAEGHNTLLASVSVIFP